jgi:hypothetical protein
MCDYLEPRALLAQKNRQELGFKKRPAGFPFVHAILAARLNTRPTATFEDIAMSRILVDVSVIEVFAGSGSAVAPGRAVSSNEAVVPNSNGPQTPGRVQPRCRRGGDQCACVQHVGRFVMPV